MQLTSDELPLKAWDTFQNRYFVFSATLISVFKNGGCWKEFIFKICLLCNFIKTVQRMCLKLDIQKWDIQHLPWVWKLLVRNLISGCDQKNNRLPTSIKHPNILPGWRIDQFQIILLFHPQYCKVSLLFITETALLQFLFDLVTFIISVLTEVFLFTVSLLFSIV